MYASLSTSSGCGDTCSCSTSTSPSEHLRISWGNVRSTSTERSMITSVRCTEVLQCDSHAIRAHCYFSSVVLPFSDAVEECVLRFIHVNGTVFAILKSKCEGIFGVKCILSYCEAAGSKACSEDTQNRAHNQRLRLVKDALLSLSRERKRAGSPDDPQRGWLLQGTNA